MRVYLYAKSIRKEHHSYVHLIYSLLKENDIHLYASKEVCSVLKRMTRKSLPILIEDSQQLIANSIQAVVSLGGDGTILGAVTMIKDAQIPILGINLGRLGFLAGVEKHQINHAIAQLASGNYKIEKRRMLYLESNLPLFDNAPFALNDFTLHKRDTSSMITIRAYINGDLLNSYWSDGIIVATPTGSTAYSLSCGGPIIFPNSGNFVLTPVAPHNLNVRPIVLSDNSVISFEIEGRSKNFLCTLDSRFETIGLKHELSIRRAHFDTHLIQINDQTFLNTLRTKISWGEDSRN